MGDKIKKNIPINMGSLENAQK